MVRYLPAPEEEFTSRSLLVYGDRDGDMIPVLHGFLYTWVNLALSAYSNCADKMQPSDLGVRSLRTKGDPLSTIQMGWSWPRRRVAEPIHRIDHRERMLWPPRSVQAM